MEQEVFEPGSGALLERDKCILEVLDATPPKSLQTFVDFLREKGLLAGEPGDPIEDFDALARSVMMLAKHIQSLPEDQDPVVDNLRTVMCKAPQIDREKSLPRIQTLLVKAEDSDRNNAIRLLQIYGGFLGRVEYDNARLAEMLVSNFKILDTVPGSKNPLIEELREIIHEETKEFLGNRMLQTCFGLINRIRSVFPEFQAAREEA